MGGKNHQPCNQYLEMSTKLSRSLSLAQAELELGNVALEDVILAELDGESKSLAASIGRLALSSAYLRDANVHCRQLSSRVKSGETISTPTAWDWKSVGANLVGRGLISSDSWNIVTRIRRESGFQSVLSFFIEQIDGLISLTEQLSREMTALQSIVNQGGIGASVNVVLEYNCPGNIKETFARLYTAWAGFNQLFLASAMCSTELWYAHSNCGSLVGESQVAASA